MAHGVRACVVFSSYCCDGTHSVNPRRKHPIAAFRLRPASNENQESDSRFEPEGDDYDPRGRVWYQDAIEDDENTGVIFTSPYNDADTDRLIVTAAAPVFGPNGGRQGVVGVDIDAEAIKDSILGLTVIGEEGYAYLLAQGSEDVFIHQEVDNYDEVQKIVDLEPVDEGEFERVRDTMNMACNGTMLYDKGGEEWLLSWSHTSVSNPFSSEEGSEEACAAGFVVVVTVSKAALLEVSEEWKINRCGVLVV